MNTAVIVALISGVCTLIGTIVTVMAGIRKAANDTKIQQAVTDAKLDELTREVRKHNNFAERLPIVEEQIKGIDKRVASLEEKTK